MSLADILTARGIRFRQSYRDKAEYQLCCPFCAQRGESEDTKFKLGVNERTGQAHCFRCDWASRSQGVELVLTELGIENQAENSRESNTGPGRIVEPVTMPRDTLDLYSSTLDPEGPEIRLVKQARAYVLHRGITKEQIQEKQIRVSLSGRYAYRILFPVIVHEELTGIVARDFTGKQKAKYLFPAGAEKHLYNLSSRCRQGVVLTEGVIKALRVEQQTRMGSVALLGHSLTDLMAEELYEAVPKGKPITIWPDPDKVGVQGAATIAIRLMRRYKVHVVWPLPDAPADELSLEKMRGLLAQPFTWKLDAQMGAYEA